MKRTCGIRHLFRILVLVLLTASTLVLSLDIKEAYAVNKETIIKNIDLDLDRDNKSDFKIRLYSENEKITYGELKTSSQEYKYMKTTTYKYSQKYNGKQIGYVEFIVNSFLENKHYMYFVNYYSQQKDICVKYDISILTDDRTPKIMSLKSMGKDKGEISRDNIQNIDNLDKPAKLNNEVRYIECKNRFVKLNRIVDTHYLGSTVYDVKVPKITCQYSSNEKGIDLKYSIPSSQNNIIRASGILSNNSMVDWDNDLAYRTVMNMDFYNDNYYFNDGCYRQNMYNYVPRLNNSNTYFKNPAGLQIRACNWVLGKGSLFNVMGLFTMYTFAEMYNEKGYIPTQPMSEWLSTDFNIGYNFYDTRFNSSTASSLIAIYKNYPDEFVMEKINKYISFYKNYYATKRFKVGNAIFVPDYMDYYEKNKINHSSLNHFLAEMEVMYVHYELTGDSDSLKIAREMLESVRKTSNNWIRKDGDLWYKVTPDGKYVSNDYPLVTYNDLVYIGGIVKTIENKVPSEFIKLLKSKETWAIKKGYIKK